MPSSKRFQVDQLDVQILPDRNLAGQACAVEASEQIRRLLAVQETVSIIFASSPSQLEMLNALRGTEAVDWRRVYAFHMDEYLGLPPDAPQGFGNYIRVRFLEHLPFRKVFYMDGNPPDVSAECERYADLLRAHPVDISFLGIGENGHIAFNDPHIADFDDPMVVKLNPDMDAVCRQQQVTDGWFPNLEAVPHQAITVTISGLLAARHIYAIVPGQTKQKIVKRCLEAPVGLACPASIIRRHPSAKLYLDSDSAALLDPAVPTAMPLERSRV